MARKRTVIVASSVANKSKKFSTTAETWGELKEDSNLSGFLGGAVEVVVNPGSVTLSRDAAELPEGDFKLYIIPTKNKSGVGDSAAFSLGQEIAAAIVQAAEKASEDQVEDLKKELICTIEDFFGVSLDDECPECDDALEEAKDMEEG